MLYFKSAETPKSLGLLAEASLYHIELLGSLITSNSLDHVAISNCNQLVSKYLLLESYFARVRVNLLIVHIFIAQA